MNSLNGITEEQVYEIADQLMATGQTPTLKSIRNDLKTGSYTTIANHLVKWKKMRLEQSPTPQPPSEFQAATLRIWNTAYREAEKLFSNERDFFDSNHATWQVEKMDLLSIIKKQEEEATAHQIQEGETQKRLDQANEELRITHDALTKVTAQWEAAELRRVETLQRADRLESKLTEFLKNTGTQDRVKKEPFGSDTEEEIYPTKNKKEVAISTGSR